MVTVVAVSGACFANQLDKSEGRYEVQRLGVVHGWARPSREGEATRYSQDRSEAWRLRGWSRNLRLFGETVLRHSRQMPGPLTSARSTPKHPGSLRARRTLSRRKMNSSGRQSCRGRTPSIGGKTLAFLATPIPSPRPSYKTLSHTRTVRRGGKRRGTDRLGRFGRVVLLEKLQSSWSATHLKL